MFFKNNTDFPKEIIPEVASKLLEKMNNNSSLIYVIVNPKSFEHKTLTNVMNMVIKSSESFGEGINKSDEKSLVDKIVERFCEIFNSIIETMKNIQSINMKKELLQEEDVTSKGFKSNGRVPKRQN